MVARGAKQTYSWDSVVGGRFIFSEVGESDSMEFPVVMGCVPASERLVLCHAHYGGPLLP
jgi:hypothetical protein